MESKITISRKIGESSKIVLRQHWGNSTPEQGAAAVFVWSDKGLQVRVAMADQAINNTATGLKQKTWELGDVAEIFIKPVAEDSAYYEFHVTPQNVILDLAIQSADKVSNAWQDRHQYQSKARSRTMISKGSWVAQLFIPWEALSFKPQMGCEMKLAVCRYNYFDAKDNSKIEYSSSAPLSELNYHRPWEWNTAVLK